MHESVKISRLQKVIFSLSTILFLALLVARGLVPEIVKVDYITLLLLVCAFLPWTFSHIKIILLTFGINLKKSGNLKSISVTAAFVIIIVARMLYPNKVKIDYISLILIVMASLPWLMPYIKTLEINGLGKFEANVLATKEEKNEIQKTIEEVESMNTLDRTENNKDYVFYSLRNIDNKLSLAGMRIELEALLRKLGEANSIDTSRKALFQISQELNIQGVISNVEFKAIREISKILNKAIHVELDSEDLENLDWVFDSGMSLIHTFENRLNEKIE